MFSSKYSSFEYLINSLPFNPYRATLMRILYRIPFITPLPFFAYPLSHLYPLSYAYFFFYFFYIVRFYLCKLKKKNVLKIGAVIRVWRNLLNDVIVWYIHVTSRTSSFHIFWHTNCNYKKNSKHTKKCNNKQNIFKTTARKL